MSLNKQDLVFLITPFVLTTIFIITGYSILVRSTPEAAIRPPSSESEIEILTNGDIKPISNGTELPTRFKGPISAVPHNQDQLDALLDRVKQKQNNIVMLSVPVTMKSDSEFSLTGADLSSEENIRRWLKTTINALHEQNIHVYVAMTLNASMTITDGQVFSREYPKFLDGIVVMANEFDVSYFSPGLSIGHPLYSSLSSSDVSKIFNTVRGILGGKYNGYMGVNLCCTSEIPFQPQGFKFIVAIPTPEFNFTSLSEAFKTTSKSGIKQVFYYDRDQGIIRSDFE